MEEESEVQLKCLFCKSEQFEIPDENYQFQSGDMVKCANCGKLNDYDAMFNVATEEGMEILQKEAEKVIKDTLKKFKF